MRVEITTHNKMGDFHGYQEWCHSGKLWFRGGYKNDNPIGYHEENTSYTKTIGQLGTEVNFYIR